MPKPYDLKITLWKFFQVFIAGGVGALIASLTKLPPTETSICFIALFKALQNYLKNA